MHPSRVLVWLFIAAMLACARSALAEDAVDTIARVKRSVVAVGTLMRERSPPFEFRGTGFVVGTGTTIATNAHVLPVALDATHNEVLAILLPGPDGVSARARTVERIKSEPGTDLALLRLAGEPLHPLALGDWRGVREGQSVLITGFPIGAVLGPFPVTHRGMVSAITPIAIPQASAGSLNPALVRRLGEGSFPVFQLDATAYPGNSGSPVYDPATGEVLGIVNMVFVKGTKEAALTQPSGITYAVPAGHLKNLLETIDPKKP
jgi:S1-C subfamily serine protease